MDADLIRRRIEAELIAAMARAGRQVATWGVDDCARWCTGVLKEAMGYDASAPWGRYDSREGAAAALGPLGLGFAIRAAARAHGWRRIAPAEAKVGDLGLALLPTRAEGPPQLINRGTVLERPALPLALQPSMMICRAPADRVPGQPAWFVGRNDTGVTMLTAKVVRFAWSVVP